MSGSPQSHVALFEAQGLDDVAEQDYVHIEAGAVLEFIKQVASTSSFKTWRVVRKEQGNTIAVVAESA